MQLERLLLRVRRMHPRAVALWTRAGWVVGTVGDAGRFTRIRWLGR